jgi:hypothetical protein
MRCRESVTPLPWPSICRRARRPWHEMSGPSAWRHDPIPMFPDRLPRDEARDALSQTESATRRSVGVRRGWLLDQLGDVLHFRVASVGEVVTLRCGVAPLGNLHGAEGQRQRSRD